METYRIYIDPDLVQVEEDYVVRKKREFRIMSDMDDDITTMNEYFVQVYISFSDDTACIARLPGGRPFTYKDFCILLDTLGKGVVEHPPDSM